MKVIIILSVFLLSGCAKFVYLVEQGIGQLSLQWKGKKISKVLNDPEVGEEIKSKIKDIGAYKTHFYEYFEKKETDIYSKVTFLDRDAVTYLVIVSYFDKVEPLKTSFPFYGKFPYLGFFKEKSAFKYVEKMKKKDYHTYKRPVQAYSTLGNFEDRILSTFFEFNKYDLAELIFHELFHTVFFVKSNVDLNENLANYFGKEMMKEYFSNDQETLNERTKRSERSKKIRMALVKLINDYKDDLGKNRPKDMKESFKHLENYLATVFRPSIENTCNDLGIEKKKCYPLKRNWNHASFSAFMTYENKGAFIKDLREKKNFTLKQYLAFLEQEYEKFKDLDSKKSFTKYLEGLN